MPNLYIPMGSIEQTEPCMVYFHKENAIEMGLKLRSLIFFLLLLLHLFSANGTISFTWQFHETANQYRKYPQKE